MFVVTTARRAGSIVTSHGIWGAAKLHAILLDFTRSKVIYCSNAGVMTFLVIL